MPKSYLSDVRGRMRRVMDELPSLEDLLAVRQERAAAVEERAAELERIAEDHSRTMRVRLSAARRAQCVREAPAPVLGFALSDDEMYSQHVAERELHRAPSTAPLAAARRLIVPRRTCGGRRRPGVRRASSRSAGGGSSGDSDEGEPARGRHQLLEDGPLRLAARAHLRMVPVVRAAPLDGREQPLFGGGLRILDGPDARVMQAGILGHSSERAHGSSARYRSVTGPLRLDQSGFSISDLACVPTNVREKRVPTLRRVYHHLHHVSATRGYTRP